MSRNLSNIRGSSSHPGNSHWREVPGTCSQGCAYQPDIIVIITLLCRARLSFPALDSRVTRSIDASPQARRYGPTSLAPPSPFSYRGPFSYCQEGLVHSRVYFRRKIWCLPLLSLHYRSFHNVFFPLPKKSYAILPYLQRVSALGVYHAPSR